MEVARRDSSILLRLDHGEDILGSISEVVEGEKSTLMVVAGIGMLSEFEIGYFDGGSYIKKGHEEAHELVSMQGSVSTEGTPRIHVHVVVANKEHNAVGGHLLGGKAWMSNEICLLRVECLKSQRTFDPEKQVGILRIQ